MASLNKAVAAGFHNAEQIRKDAEFGSLRNRDDFKRLLEKLTTPARPAFRSPAALAELSFESSDDRPVDDFVAAAARLVPCPKRLFNRG